MVYNHRWVEVIAARQVQLDRAYAARPERFVNHAPVHPELPSAVWINPPIVSATTAEIERESQKIA